LTISEDDLHFGLRHIAEALDNAKEAV
jgi:hypothetical protein